jgi:hypothetical protein
MQRTDSGGYPNPIGMASNFIRGVVKTMRSGQIRNLGTTICDLPVWITTAHSSRSPMADGVPWITNSAARFLKESLSGKGTVFEWGSGGSTIFYSSRARHVVTVEHDLDWFQKVQSALRSSYLDNVELILSEPEILPPGERLNPANSGDYVSSDEIYRGFHFTKYSKTIANYPFCSFELVSVDGRARPSCIREAIPHIAVSGFLLLDNSDRDHYAVGLPDVLKEWRRMDFYGPINYSGAFGQTTIWQRMP